MEIFPSHNKIICDSLEIKNLIKKFVFSEGWRTNYLDVFSSILESIDIKMPVTLTELVESEQFKCITSEGIEYNMFLRPSNDINFDQNAQIWISNGEVTNRYGITCALTVSSIPSAFIECKKIKRTGKELEIQFKHDSCLMILKFAKTHLLKIEFDYPSWFSPNNEVLEYEDFQNFLLENVDLSTPVSELYENMIDLLKFSDEDISCKNIMISFVENFYGYEETLSTLLISEGQIKY